MPSAAPSKSELRLLRPSTRCATITPRPADYKSIGGGLNVTGGTHHTAKTPDNAANTFLTSIGDYDDCAVSPEASQLSGDELLSQLKNKVKSHHQEIKQAFYAFDNDRSSFVTLLEFRKVVENFIFPLTDVQFQQLVKKIDGITNQRLNYNQFLFKINKTKRTTPSNLLGRITPANDSLDNIVKKLQDKLQDSGTRISKAMRMFDTNMNGKMKKADLKRVLENFAFHISKDQFEKLYRHYDTSRDGSIDYINFLKSVIATSLPIKPPSASPTNALVIYEEEAAEKEAEEEMKQAAEPLWCETVPLVDVEIKLRNKIKRRIQLLFRTFKSMDIDGDGYVTVEQLRRALEKFVFQMTDSVFENLMERMDIKAKHRLRYEAFLYKLQDRRVGGYGQALVMKPSHRYHPVIESSEEPNLEALLDRLKSKVINGYSSIKQAFLVFDENRSGKISKRDFKNVIDGFCFRLSDSQFGKLMAVVDPTGRGHVTYQHFFKLFEETESTGAHKWLNSVHRVNKPREPKYLDDARFEELLAKKLSDERKMVAIAFGNFDKEGTGVVSKHQLKKFLERFSVPFSKAQFEGLVSRAGVNSDGTVDFYSFMGKIGVDLEVCDMGHSHTIHNNNSTSGLERAHNHRERLEVVAQRAHDHTALTSVDSILSQMQDYIHQRAADMRKLFTKYDEDGSGRIKRAQFRRFLVKAGFLMDNAQFRELCSRMNVGKSLTYQDFLEHFQRQNNGIYTNTTTWAPKIVPPAPVVGMSCEEGMKLLRTKIHNRYRTIRDAFHAADRDSDGLVNRTDLVALLTLLLIPMSRETISELWGRLAQGKKRINVAEFVAVFEETEDIESHKWLVSVHHSNAVHPPQNMDSDAVLKTFRTKALDQYFSLNKCFMALDKDGKGKLSKKKLRQALHDFCIPINNDEFFKLWRHFDDDRTGYIDHEQFVRRVAEDFNPGDDKGTSTHIVNTSADTADMFNSYQMRKRDDILMKQINTLSCITNEELERLFRLNMHDHYCNLRTAFKAADRENLGYLRKCDLRRVLFDFNFLVDDEQFNYILKRAGMEKKSRMSYEKFMAFFESPQDIQKGIENFESLENRIAPYIAQYPELSAEDAEARMRYCISEIQDVLLQAFGAVDMKEHGIVGPDVIRRVLDNFCFVMTNKQFAYFTKKFPYVSDGRVDYKHFVKTYSQTEADESQQWLEAVLGNRAQSTSSMSGTLSQNGRYSRRTKSCTNLLAPVPRPETAPFINAERVESNIDAQIRDRWMELHKYFKQRSKDNTTVSTEIFQGGLEQTGIVLTVEDLGILCRKYDVRGDNNVDYSTFLKKFSALGRRSGPRLSSQNSSRASNISLCSGRLSNFSYNLSRAASCTSLDSILPDTARTVSRNLASQMGLRRSNTQLGDLTPGIGIEPPHYVISCIASDVIKQWKDLRKQFKACDKKGQGWISTDDFRNTMRSNNVNISENDFSQLIGFYKTHSNGKVYYNDFLRAFLSVTTVD